MSNILDLTVIVPNYNTRDLLRNCLASIYKSTFNINFEVICVDDTSKDGSADMVEQEFPQVRLVRNQTNLLYAANNNLGMKMSKARYALLLNSDVIVKKGAFEAMVRFMDDNLHVAAAGPKLLNPDGTIQHCIRSFPSVKTMFFQTLNWHKYFPDSKICNAYYYTDFDYAKTQPVISIGTTSYIIRREVWENYGMLDERFPMYMVDWAYNRMLKQNNQLVYYIAEAEVIHLGSQSTNQNSLKEIKRLHDVLHDYYEAYIAALEKHAPLTRAMYHFGISLRKQFKILEYHVSADKRVIKGPGAPAKDAASKGLAR